MRNSTIASLIALVFTSPVLTQTVFAAEQINLDEVVVTASRTPQPRESVIADVTVIDEEEIQRAGQSTLVELLAQQPGVEITSSGGAGTISSIFMRGTNSNQVVVLIDGLRVGAATSGTTTFENIPLSQTEKIEILRGPATSLYGQDAIGGVIQIFTKKGIGKPQFYASLGYGTYNTKTAEVGIRGSLNDTGFSLNVSSLDTDSFSAKPINTGAQADNDGYRNLSASGSLSHKIAEGHEIGVQVFSSKGHANYDSSNTFRDFVDLTQLSYGLFSKNQFTSSWLSTIRIGEGVDDNQNHSNGTSSSQFKTKQKQLSWQNDVELPVGTFTLLYDRLEQKVITDVPFAETNRDTDGFMIGYIADIDKHAFQANLRSDHSSLFGTHLTGGLGYGYKINPNWRITGSYAKAFKAPTFNDQFYVDQFGAFNNPNVKPEKSENFEASLRFVDNQRDASLTIYNNKINDFITLDSGFLATNVNAKIEGMTLSASQSWYDWQIKGSLDIQSPRNEDNDKLLARRANRHANLNLSREWGNWRFASEIIASSIRYNDADSQFPLAGYGIINLTADYKINQEWALQGRLNNALDKKYTLASSASIFEPTAPAYNTPRTNLFVTIRWQPK
jgi:vitamin B12 transporter